MAIVKATLRSHKIDSGYPLAALAENNLELISINVKTENITKLCHMN